MAYTTIDNPELYFQTKLYTGNGSTQSITLDGSENMQPDWVWIKRRNGAESHALFDSVRGATKQLASNSTDVEETVATSLTSFDSDGFSLGSYSRVNASSDTFASWNWLAGGSSSSNSNGSITSYVSANSTSGFSIVSYTGTGSVATIGHGLGVAPKLIIVKTRSYSNQAWPVDVREVDGILYFNETSAKGSYGNSSPFPTTAPTTSVFSVGSPENTNASSATYIAYCFSEVKGYSKFGSYVGNQNNDGTFIYTGFKPAFFIGKEIISSNWYVKDNKRLASFNPANGHLYPNRDNVEEDYGDFDFLSNGIKIRHNGTDVNESGVTYIYMAFAESPFVNSSGIPCNAR